MGEHCKALTIDKQLNQAPTRHDALARLIEI
jgi:hypothetical protein